MPEPKEPVSKEIKEAYKEAHIDLEALYRGEDPFGVEKTEPEGLEEVDLDDLNLEDLDAQVAKK